jgi:programmed cell death protein 5
MVKPEKASAVEGLIVSMATSGKLQARVSEAKLIEMLEGIGAKHGKAISINIQRKVYAFDSDDSDDDNDDDLL